MKEIHDRTPHNPFAAGRPPIPFDERKTSAGRVRRKYERMAREAAQAGKFKDASQFLESVIAYAVKHNLLAEIRKESVDN